MRKKLFIIEIVFFLTIFAFMSGCTDRRIVEPNSPVQFIVPDVLPEARVGEPYIYCFCQPDRTDVNDLCGSSVNPCTNPTGGNEPYHFQLDSVSGFPPLGLTLYPNGLLMGTPSAAGVSTFTVCAVDMGSHQRCVQTSLTVLEQGITVSPDDVLVEGQICFDEPCEVSTTVVVTSNEPWHIVFVTGSGTRDCFDPVAEFSRYWSVCPNSGDAGETTVTLSTMIFGESTPSYMDEQLIDRGSTIRFEAVDDFSNFAELHIALELPYYG